MLVGSAQYDKHETGLARVAQAKPYKMCMLHGFWVCFTHISSTSVAAKLVQCVKMWMLLAADLPKTCTCGPEHGQPAQRTMSKVIFDGFPWVHLVPIKPKWDPQLSGDVPVRGSRARLVQEHHQHNDTHGIVSTQSRAALFWQTPEPKNLPFLKPTGNTSLGAGVNGISC